MGPRSWRPELCLFVSEGCFHPYLLNLFSRIICDGIGVLPRWRGSLIPPLWTRQSFWKERDQHFIPCIRLQAVPISANRRARIDRPIRCLDATPTPSQHRHPLVLIPQWTDNTSLYSKRKPVLRSSLRTWFEPIPQLYDKYPKRLLLLLVLSLPFSNYLTSTLYLLSVPISLPPKQTGRRSFLENSGVRIMSLN